MTTSTDPTDRAQSDAEQRPHTFHTALAASVPPSEPAANKSAPGRTPPSEEPFTTFSPANAVTRRIAVGAGIVVTFVNCAGRAPLRARIHSSNPVLIAYERGLRGGGESTIEGLTPSSERDLTHKLVFVPAGHDYRETHDPLFDLSAIYFCFDPRRLGLQAGRPVGPWPAPRLMFDDAAIWNTVCKIRAALSNPIAARQSYVEALGLVLAHEVAQADSPVRAPRAASAGGLAPWQQRKIASYIDDNFADQVTLATMADLVDLSPYYFCRAFKKSFGLPPHRYLAQRRIERAKQLLIEHRQSITHIALEVGFDETSSFSAAFRKATGQTPTAYQRSIG